MNCRSRNLRLEWLLAGAWSEQLVVTVFVTLSVTLTVLLCGHLGCRDIGQVQSSRYLLQFVSNYLEFAQFVFNPNISIFIFHLLAILPNLHLNDINANWLLHFSIDFPEQLRKRFRYVTTIKIRNMFLNT